MFRPMKRQPLYGSNSTRGSYTKAIINRDGCSACQKTNSRCDEQKPACSRCQTLHTECVYTIKKGGRRWSILRRKNRMLERERNEARGIISCLQSRPETEAREIYIRLRTSTYSDDLDTLIHDVASSFPENPAQGEQPQVLRIDGQHLEDKDESSDITRAPPVDREETSKSHPTSIYRSASYASSCSSAASCASRTSKSSRRSRRRRPRRVRKASRAAVRMPSRSPSSPASWSRRFSPSASCEDRTPADELSDINYVCRCCSNDPHFSESASAQNLLEAERRFSCADCPLRFKSRPEMERHRKWTHLRCDTWSCEMLHTSWITLIPSTILGDNNLESSDLCGYCGRPSSGDLHLRHLEEVHGWKQCTVSKRFFQLDLFHQHLVYGHHASQGPWIAHLIGLARDPFSADPASEPVHEQLWEHKTSDAEDSKLVRKCRKCCKVTVRENPVPEIEPDWDDPTPKAYPSKSEVNECPASPTHDAPSVSTLLSATPNPGKHADPEDPRLHEPVNAHSYRNQKLGNHGFTLGDRVTELFWLIARLCRRKPRKNHSRLEWCCGCGHHFWGDFMNTEPEDLLRLVSQLQQHGFAVETTCGNTTPSDTANATSTTADRQISNATPSTSKTSALVLEPGTTPIPATPMVGSSALGTVASGSASTSFLTTGKPVFLELCINRSSRLTHLGEIVLVDGMGQQLIATDLELFASIRAKYNSLKRKGIFALLYQPRDIHYVQFGTHVRAQQTDIYQKPEALPPHTEVTEHRYHYYECPLTPLPPMPSQTFYQYFRQHAPNCASRSTLFSDRLPKKLGASMTSLHSADKLEFGWGVHIIEGPNKPVLAALVAGILVVSFVTSVVYDVCMGNTDSGFAIGQWLVAVLSAMLSAVYFHLQDR